MRKHPLVVVLVNVLVFCVAAEALALVIFYYQHGWLFYIDPYRTTYAVIPETRGGQLTLEGLHPYFGPTHKPGVPFDVPMKAMKWDAGPGEPATYRVPDVATNNFGFTSRTITPSSRRTTTVRRRRSSADRSVTGSASWARCGWSSGCRRTASSAVEKSSHLPEPPGL